MKKILEVKDLNTWFYTKKGIAKAVHGISFDLAQGEILGIIGESGSGKSVVAKSIMQIVPRPGRIETGEIRFKGKDLLGSCRTIDSVRGKEITMIFQEPMTSLNPALTIGRQLREGLMLHLKLSRTEADKISCKYLKRVKISNPNELLSRYPHHLSGGMRQRVMIAMALSTNASILLADEPTTALDVTIQQQIIYLLKELREQLNMSIIFITHDMGVINEIADNTAVMYCGKMQEYATTYDVIKDPLHPYTRALLEAIPRLEEEKDTLITIPGTVPSLLKLPEGCNFYSRCTFCSDDCYNKEPPLYFLKDGRKVRCWKYRDVAVDTEKTVSIGKEANNE